MLFRSMDPQADWPLTSEQFLAYLKDKYSVAAGGDNYVLTYTQGTVHHYEKVITTIDGDSNTTAVKNVEIDENTYNLIIPTTEVKKFPNGSSITYSISAATVSIYDYENSINESKRNIKLINASYATAMETQYQSLVKS